jgi:hypothetical protein
MAASGVLPIEVTLEETRAEYEAVKADPLRDRDHKAAATNLHTRKQETTVNGTKDGTSTTMKAARGLSRLGVLIDVALRQLG